MAFPQTPLPVAVELQLGGTWTDVTSDVYVRDRIQISRGRADEASRPDPAKCTLSFNNRAGKYSPRNPISPYYGQLGRNTPLRVSIPGSATYLFLPGPAGALASTPDAAALDVLGDIDIRIDLSLDSAFVDSADIMSKWDATGNQRSWVLGLSFDGTLNFTWSATGVATFSHNSTLPVTLGLGHRIAVRVTFDVDNGAGGNTATFWTAPTIAGPWTQLGASSTIPFTTSIFNSTAPLRIGDTAPTNLSTPPTGRINAAQVYNGIAGSLVANPDFTAQTPGATTFVDSAGRTWTLAGSAELTTRQVRFWGEVSEWPTRWDVSGQDVWTPVSAAGVLRRYGQGTNPLASPLQRSLVATRPLAYWPCEDGRDSTQAYSPISGVGAAAAAGLTFADAVTLAGSSPLPTLTAASTLTATVPAAATGSSQVEMMIRADSVTGSGNVLLQLTSTGTVATWIIILDPGVVTVSGFSAAGALLGSGGATPTDLVGAGDWRRLVFTATQSGGNIAWRLRWYAMDDSSLTFSGTIAGTSGNVTGINTAFGAGLAGVHLGHIAVRSATGLFINSAPALGYPGETAWDRVNRLCTETGTLLTMGGGEPGLTPMGPQHADTLLNLLAECADADGATLGEEIRLPALSMRGRSSLYTQPTALALDYTTQGHVAPPLEPADDDQHTRNDVIVSRINGSSARAALESGAMSTQAPPNGIGAVPEQVPALNVQTDSQLAGVASWRLYLGTFDASRYPSVHVDLAAAPSLIPAVLALATGDRITIASPPAWLPPELIDLIAEGWTETLGLYDWDIVFNCSPGKPWRVAQLDSGDVGRLDTAGSQLAASATSAATSLSVTTTSGPVWSPSMADSPWDVIIGGEQVTVAAVGNLLNLTGNPFFAVDLTGWAAQSSSIARSTAVVHTAAGAVASMQITPDGVSASGGAMGLFTAVGSVTPGATYTVAMWAYSPGGHSDLRPAADWFDSSGVFLSSGLGSGTAVSAGQWTYIQQTLTAPASASMAKPRARHGGTPPASAVWYAWAIRLVPTASVTTTSPQQMTVIRSVNGIVKAQPSGTDVRLLQPMILAL